MQSENWSYAGKRSRRKRRKSNAGIKRKSRSLNVVLTEQRSKFLTEDEWCSGENIKLNYKEVMKM